MPDLSFALYDTAVFGATAKVVHPLFQVREGGDATHDRFFTNMRGAGSLPQNETFVIDKIEVFPDGNFNVADRENMYLNSYIELVYSDKVIFQSPLRDVAGHNNFGGHFTQAAAADEGIIGLEGDGYMLKKPLEIKGGTNFKVNVGQGTVTTAAQNVKVVLHGTLVAP